ncbi:FAD-binding oxidoreductase [Microlunatus antarcticus]|uniref:Glycolate oxidase n=1 Tax=Microlunatus antarcticus TaxID=53388 RepID=A0A7W5JX05_9ACTN|nr:FAD-linked oxidase C-terminal domain-containing protein [Microlunatus antarcticus]MBB3327868.1 glycolate oxidase [Microlunatus antarcticus]
MTAGTVARSDWSGLAAALSPSAVVAVDEASRAAAANDRSGWVTTSSPDVVVRVGTVADVQEVLRFATATRTPVVTRGGGTGLAGGAVAAEGSLVLDVSGLTRIVDVRPDDAVAVVEPGVLTADLDRVVRAHGLRYAPDPASAAISTIGGNIATNAGGLRCVKYGVTRDAVLALDVVLADGTLLQTGQATVKGVAGYDLTSLLVGSEGTLGVIVGATLRLTAAPTLVATAAAFFYDLDAATAATLAVTRAGVRPSTLELVDGATLAAIDAAQGSDLATRGQAFVLVQTDGFAAEAELAVAAAELRRLGGQVQVTTDDAEAERLMSARRLALPSIERLGRVLIEDIAVPRSQLAEAVRGVAAIAKSTGVRIFTFAHAGDGNLHPIIAVASEDAGHLAAVDRAADAVFALALRLGGTVSGEHGVGLLKRGWLDAELGPRSRDLQHGIKAVFDPLNLLNPGKAL